MSKFNYANLDVEVKLDAITPSIIWSGRHKEFERKMISNEIHDNLSPEERSIIAERVRRCIEVMYDYVDEWLPDAFSINEAGSLLTIEMNLLVSDMEEDVIEIFKATSGRKRVARKELLELIENWDSYEDGNSEG